MGLIVAGFLLVVGGFVAYVFLWIIVMGFLATRKD
jgi:hypothetical protein